MKNRQEEDILRLAFGDVTGSEAEQIRKAVEADPKAGELFSSYRGLSEGLRRLPVPEHQLSTERLRNAILDQNLKPRQEGSFWRFLWAPALVGASAYLFAAMFLNGPKAPSATLTSPGTDWVPYASDPSRTSIELPTDPSKRATTAFPGGAIDKRLEGTATMDATPKRRSSSGSDTAVTMAETHPVGGVRSVQPDPSDRHGVKFRTTDANEAVAMNVESAIANNALALDAAPAAASPIVIIGNDTDSMTGANKATEVSTVSNVVIGG